MHTEDDELTDRGDGAGTQLRSPSPVKKKPVTTFRRNLYDKYKKPATDKNTTPRDSLDMELDAVLNDLKLDRENKNNSMSKEERQKLD